VALRIVSDAATAEEVAHEVFLLVWRKASKYDPARGPFLPWLIMLSRNKALDQLRLKSERQRRRENPTEELLLPQDIYCPEAALDQKRRIERVHSALAMLTSRHRRAIELAYLGELTQCEIAAQIRVPLGTVKTWIREGLLLLKKQLLVPSSPESLIQRSFTPAEAPAQKTGKLANASVPI